MKFHQGMTKYYKSTPEKEIYAGIHIKDEAKRLNTGSFKILGVSYAIYKMFEEECNGNGFQGLCDYFEQRKVCFVTASDGNFGIAVSYFCKLINQKCKVYLPHSTPQYYIDKIAENNATIVFCEGDYDECVNSAIQFSIGNNVKLVLDTAIRGKFMEEVARNVIVGYCTMFLESRNYYDYMFIPTGVGGLLAAAILYNIHIGNKECKIIKQSDPLEIPYITLKKFLDDLDCSDFIQCSRNTIINQKYIDNLDIPNQVIKLKNGYGRVGIGIRFKKNLKGIDV